jgi:Rhamnogalacturonan lyase family 11, C-terminal domain
MGLTSGRWRIVLALCLSLGLSVAGLGEEMRLWHQIDTAAYSGTFVCPGDLDGDGQVDFVLYKQGPMTAPGYLVAVDAAGQKRWDLGDRTIQSHLPDGQWNEPALRGICFVYDIDRDGKSEVITELWKEDRLLLCVLEGGTGKVLHERLSPFDRRVRSGKRSRCHPVGRVAFLDGPQGQPSIVLKYGASNHVPCLAVALGGELNTLWQLEASPHAMGHVPTVGDVDGDGRDEIILGTLLADPAGRTLWEKQVDRHADCTAIADVHPAQGNELLLSICSTGPVYCMSAQGSVLWEKAREEVPHGQGIWTGDFLADEPGTEAVILRSGHVGDFLTVRGTDGAPLATFRHRRNYKGYPDFPCVVNWKPDGEQSLWIPIDRMIIDGRGQVVAELGPSEPLVKELLKWGESKSNIAVQAFALDLCGDSREELVLYQPYNGSAILIFTQSDGEATDKPYVHEKDAYNIRSYF